MSNSRFSGAKGKRSNEIGDHGDAQNHGLVSNQLLDLHQSNQSVGAGINVENTSLTISNTPELPRSPQPSNTNLRKRKADRKDSAKFNKKEIDDGFNRLKNAQTSLEDENVYLKNRCASLQKSLRRQKKTSVYLKDKNNELTDKVTDLSTLVLTVSDREIQLGERIAQLEASNAQLLARNAQLENMQLI